MILVKSTVRKMKAVLDEIVEKCTEKGISVGELQAEALHDIHSDPIYVINPLILGVDKKGRTAQVLCLKEGEKDPITLTVSFSLSLLDYQV